MQIEGKAKDSFCSINMGKVTEGTSAFTEQLIKATATAMYGGKLYIARTQSAYSF